jgi:hypothetical protein
VFAVNTVHAAVSPILQKKKLCKYKYAGDGGVRHMAVSACKELLRFGKVILLLPSASIGTT